MLSLSLAYWLANHGLSQGGLNLDVLENLPDGILPCIVFQDLVGVALPHLV